MVLLLKPFNQISLEKRSSSKDNFASKAKKFETEVRAVLIRTLIILTTS